LLTIQEQTKYGSFLFTSIYQIVKNQKESAKHVLEVGIGDWHQGVTNGGSIKLWHDYFTNATVHALDICSIDKVWDGIKNNDKIKIYASSDAYDKDFFNTHFLQRDIKCDFMLDDGPHTLESMIAFIQLYSQIMADDGILIIEDVQSADWLQILYNAVPEHLKKYVKIYDLRQNKNRYDDIVFTIDKLNI
jgi:hypothetical protein